MNAPGANCSNTDTFNAESSTPLTWVQGIFSSGSAGPAICGVRSQLSAEFGVRNAECEAAVVAACGFTGLSSPVFPGFLGTGTGDWKVAFTRRQECRRYASVLGVGRARRSSSAGGRAPRLPTRAHSTPDPPLGFWPRRSANNHPSGPRLLTSSPTNGTLTPRRARRLNVGFARGLPTTTPWPHDS